MNDYTLGVLTWLRLVRFKNRSDQLTNDFLKRFDLTTAQFDVLMQIRTFQPLNQMELAKKVTVTEGGISRMLVRLEKEGYIERKQDWKTKMISLTEKGEAIMNEAFPAQLAFQTSFFDEVLSKDEQKTLLSLMSRLEKHSRNKQVPSQP
ncbi:MarR family winged helix-turn-helix transcriptional regulator [Paenibacillus barengoltzii]|uniref:MarR family winged helix-turn-helix transcriptional regulator n=1 Tax=Paenibacillus barengoltzii TaxID=343517 RepID=UPI000A08DBF0|nr:MarR family transcriptional regulator [Paenibacillus barengoltzii]MEC2343095.1 MarR family transcriptional regulator [Paenibacillus barengoltzii]SMF57553.1 transcriptional regulator, MarR family [Paenibacillus barengoltzii]